VAGGNAGPVEKDLVGERSLLAESIGEGDPSRRGLDWGKAGLSPRSDGQGRATMALLLLPIQCDDAQPGRCGQGDQAIQRLTALQHGSVSIASGEAGRHEKLNPGLIENLVWV